MNAWPPCLGRKGLKRLLGGGVCRPQHDGLHGIDADAERGCLTHHPFELELDRFPEAPVDRVREVERGA
jgi:hypothetical protein